MTRAQQQQQQIAIEALLDFGKDLSFETLAAVFIHVITTRPDVDIKFLMQTGNVLCQMADDIERKAA